MRVLDTDICVELLRGNASIIEHRSGIDGPVVTSWMTAAELYYGAERSAAPTKNRLPGSVTLPVMVLKAACLPST